MSMGQIYILIAIISGCITIAAAVLRVAFRAGELVSDIKGIKELLANFDERMDKMEDRVYEDAIRNPQRRRRLPGNQ